MMKSGMLLAGWLPLAGFLVTSCVSLTPGGERIQVLTDRTALNDCRYLGVVRTRENSTRPGSSLTGNFAIARENARTELRNKAAQMGADTLYGVGTRDDFFGVDAWAHAYYCGRPVPIPRRSESAVGCRSSWITTYRQENRKRRPWSPHLCEVRQSVAVRHQLSGSVNVPCSCSNSPAT